MAVYENIRYQYQLTPDKRLYNIFEGAGCEADFYIPDRYRYGLGLHSIVAEFSEEGNLEELSGVVNIRQELIDIRENVVTTIEDVDFHIEYQNSANIQIYLETETAIQIGRHENNKITLPRCQDDFAFILDKTTTGVWTLYPFPEAQDAIYVNNHRFSGISHTLETGDIIHFAGYRIKMGETCLTLYHQNAYNITDLIEYEPEIAPETSETPNTRYPGFQRPPRILQPVPTGTITIPNPPNPPQKDRFGLLIRIAPMLGMILMMTLMGILRARGVYMIAMVGVMTITAIVTTYRYLSDKKKKKQDEAERVNFYEILLNRKRKEIRTLINQQSKALEHTYPDPQTYSALAEQVSPRLWERTMDYGDYFRVRIGKNEQPLSFTIDHTPQETAEAAKDPLHQDAAKLAQSFQNIPDLPQSISLWEAYTGIVGPTDLTVPHALSLISHLCVFHSYNDFSLIVVYPEAREQHFLPLKWLPHTWIGERQFKAMVNETTRSNILDSLTNILKERETDYTQNKSAKKPLYQPIVFFVADLKLIYNHEIRKYLTQSNRHLGVYALFLSESPYALPESVKTILTLTGSTEATLYQETDPTPRAYIPDLLTPAAAEKIARALAPLDHIRESTDKDLPETVTLLELHQAETVEDLNIEHKWRGNKPYKTLTVPIGLRTADKILELDLHEKSHGPHGLLAGTTGSGKSETLQSYILSLAIHFHPHDVAFLLIDYKGGGMANLFDDLPHLLGTITNLDGAQSMRALVAIKSELRRRQAVLAEHEVNHINHYQQKYAEGEAPDPMPHLFIISDEFAELKSEQPDFIKELVSAARIGRSLGVHLILATQRPSGVVNDQIWSNSNFRICLKVQNAADSQEMLKTPDAAHIQIPGRGYLQVGANIIYEQFQSAYTGAEYNPKKTKTAEKPDNNIYLWNELGQARILTKDFAAAPLADTATQRTTELDAIISGISQTFHAMNLAKVPSPWLPPLRDDLCLAEIIAMDRADILQPVDQWTIDNEGKMQSIDAYSTLTPIWADDLRSATCGKDNNDIKVAVGLADEIHQQRQTPLTINFTKDGNAAVFGSAATGKSTFLRTIAFSLALTYTPEQAVFFILDFGNNSLMPLKHLPHTANAFTADESEAIDKLHRYLIKEIKHRKDLIGQASVSSIALYNEITQSQSQSHPPGQPQPPKPIPALFLFLDNIDILRDQSKAVLAAFLKDLTRDGQALAIHFIFAGSRPSVVSSGIMSNVKNKYFFYLNDKTDITNTLGRTELQSESIPGRGLTRLEEICSFQAALPIAGTDAEQIQNFARAAETLQRYWQGALPQGVPMMPETLYLNDFYRQPSVTDILEANDKKLPLALDNETVEAFSIDFAQTSHLNITAKPGAGKTNLIKVILETIARKEQAFKITIIDDAMAKLSGYRPQPQPMPTFKQQQEYYQNDHNVNDNERRQNSGHQNHNQSDSHITYITEKIDIINKLETTAQEVITRKENYAQKMQTGHMPQSAGDYYNTLQPHMIIVNNVKTFLNHLSDNQRGSLINLLDQSQLTGIHFIFVSNVQDFPRGMERLPAAFKNIGTGFTFTNLKDVQILPVPAVVTKIKPLGPGEAYYIHAGSAIRVKIPLVPMTINDRKRQ